MPVPTTAALLALYGELSNQAAPFETANKVPSTAWAALKLLSKTGSYQATRSGIIATGELEVKAFAEPILALVIIAPPLVMPATNIPITKITIESSMSEKPIFLILFCFFIGFKNDYLRHIKQGRINIRPTINLE